MQKQPLSNPTEIFIHVGVGVRKWSIIYFNQCWFSCFQMDAAVPFPTSSINILWQVCVFHSWKCKTGRWSESRCWCETLKPTSLLLSCNIVKPSTGKLKYTVFISSVKIKEALLKSQAASFVYSIQGMVAILTWDLKGKQLHWAVCCWTREGWPWTRKICGPLSVIVKRESCWRRDDTVTVDN